LDTLNPIPLGIRGIVDFDTLHLWIPLPLTPFHAPFTYALCRFKPASPARALADVAALIADGHIFFDFDPGGNASYLEVSPIVVPQPPRVSSPRRARSPFCRASTPSLPPSRSISPSPRAPTRNCYSATPAITSLQTPSKGKCRKLGISTPVKQQQRTRTASPTVKKQYNNNNSIRSNTMVANYDLDAGITGIPTSDEDIRRLFDTLDTNHNGYLTKEEFKYFYRRIEWFGLEPTEIEIDRLLRSYSSLHNDLISYEEFAILCLKLARR
jgi:hypothetical protein